MKNQFTEKIEDWSNFTITNRFMFNKIFSSNIEDCKKLLEILLGIKISKIEKPKTEFTIEGSSPQNRGIRFDVFTQDSQRIYDIEMQVADEGDLPERSRFYQSMMDVDFLEKSQPYTSLKDSIIIFICKFDPFGNAHPKYEFQNLDIIDLKDITRLNDRSKKVFFNVNEYAKIKDDLELQGLLEFFSENKVKSEFSHRLTDLVNIAHQNER